MVTVRDALARAGRAVKVKIPRLERTLPSFRITTAVSAAGKDEGAIRSY